MIRTSSRSLQNAPTSIERAAGKRLLPHAEEPVRDAEDAVYTDHSIRRRPRGPAVAPGVDRRLISSWETPVDDRDLGLAYAVAGEDAGLCQRASELLRKSEARDPQDVAGDEDRARALCERILRVDPAQVAVAINLGSYYIHKGCAREAMRLWTDALSRNPGLTGARINLAVSQYQAGDPGAAETTLLKALQYDPDNATPRKMLSEVRAGAR
jgi:tetratricopeptide (TPR) repeat protein